MTDDNLYMYERLNKLVDEAEKVGWASRDEQLRRFRVMADTAKHHDFSISDGSVLDVGCGLGAAIGALALPESQYTGIDRFAPYVEQAKKLHPGYTFRVEDVRDATGTYDTVLASGTLGWHSSPDQRRILAAMWERTDRLMVYNASSRTVPLLAPIAVIDALECKKWTINHNYGLSEDYTVHMWKR